MSLSSPGVLRCSKSKALLFSLPALSLLLCGVSLAEVGGRFTVWDSIEKTVFVVDTFNGKEPATFSPDGRHFFVIPTRGILATNQIEGTIWLFDSASVPSTPKAS